jgi:transcriptional regulator with XRE-family HTH domain
MIEYAARIREFRTMAGISESEMAKRLNISDMEYFDLELHNDELCTAFDLVEIKTLTNILGITFQQLFAYSEPVFISFGEIKDKIISYVETNNTTLQEVEDQAGWELESIIANPNEIWDRPIMFLQDICNVLKIDWHAVLPQNNVQQGAAGDRVCRHSP